MAVLVEVALLQLVGVAPAGQQVGQQFHVRGHVVRMRDGGDVQRQQFLLAIAQHLAHRGVDPDEMAVRMGQCHADGGMLEGAEEALLALVQAHLERMPLGDVDQRGEHATDLAVGIEVGLEVAVRVAPVVAVVEFALVAGHPAGVGLFERRTGPLVVGLADHVDQASAEQAGGIDAQPGPVRFIGVAEPLFAVEIGHQRRRTVQHSRGPVGPFE